MNLRRFALETTVLVVAAVLCATIANLLASRERKLAFVGSYPNARVVTVRTAEASAITPALRTEPAQQSAPAPVMAPPPAAPAVAAPSPAAPVGSGAPKDPAPRTTAVKPSAAAPKKPAAEELLARFPVHEKTAYLEISPADADWLFDRGALFLDARRTSVFEQGHVAGALSFPVWEAEIDSRVGELANQGRDGRLPVVVYCSGGECEDSHMLAQKLWGVFFNNVLVYRDGFPDWQQRGRPVATGSQP